VTEEIIGFEVFTLDLPFRHTFKHAAKQRRSSESLVLKCFTSSRGIGFGETLPRTYVTGESLEDTYGFLADLILPHLVGLKFSKLDEVIGFLEECDGEPPPHRADIQQVRTAAWCAVDLALLDAFSKAFAEQIALNIGLDVPGSLRYSAVVSGVNGWNSLKTLVKVRAYGFKHVKLKVDRANHLKPVRLARRILGRACDIRIDANMDWTLEMARRIIPELTTLGVRSFEQPLPRGDLNGAARLVKETGSTIMADESFNNCSSLKTLINRHACNAVNVRLSKCGGLIASLARCKQAEKAGIEVQVGCQVGETSLLSAAQLTLLAAYHKVRYVEGAFGKLLLQHDPCYPVLQFGYGGRPPARPSGYGFGIELNTDYLKEVATHYVRIGDTSPGR